MFVEPESGSGHVLLSGLLSIVVSVSHAGIEMLTCDDLSMAAPTPAVDFATQIQPIFDQRCSFCHGFNGGLTLESGQAYADLVCQPTETAGMPPGAVRVLPADAMGSWLFNRVNCSDAGGGFRMPPGAPLSAEDQRLIADWIDQGAWPSGDVVFISGLEPRCD